MARLIRDKQRPIRCGVLPQGHGAGNPSLLSPTPGSLGNVELVMPMREEPWTGYTTAKNGLVATHYLQRLWGLVFLAIVAGLPGCGGPSPTATSVEHDRRSENQAVHSPGRTEFDRVLQKTSSCNLFGTVIFHLSPPNRCRWGWVAMTQKLVNLSSATVIQVPVRPRTGRSTTAPITPPSHPPSRSEA